MKRKRKRKRGQLFFLVGNSGSGKDSLLKAALDMWPDDFEPVKIPHRYITREPHPTEPFHSVSSEKFLKLKKQNKFCLTWHVYGLDYGVPEKIKDWLEKGEIVIVNVSRAIIPDARKIFPDLKVIFVKVPFDISLERLKSRNRESENSPVFKARVERARKNQNLPSADFVVDNTGTLKIGGKILKKYLISFAKKRD